MGIHIAGIFKRKLTIVLIPVLLGLCGWFGYMNYASVKARLDLNHEVSQYQDNVKQALLDIRDIEKAYKKTYYKYSADPKELHSYLMNGFVRYVTSKCDIRQAPGRRMTFAEADSLGIDPNTDAGNSAMERIDDDEAVKLGLITKDTILIPALDYVFNGFKICPCNDSTGNYSHDITVTPMSNPDKRRFIFDKDILATSEAAIN